MPAHPIRDAAVAVIAQGVLRLTEQVVGGLGGIRCGTAGVAEGEVLRERLNGRYGAGGRRGSTRTHRFFLAGRQQQAHGQGREAQKERHLLHQAVVIIRSKYPAKVRNFCLPHGHSPGWFVSGGRSLGELPPTLPCLHALWRALLEVPMSSAVMPCCLAYGVIEVPVVAVLVAMQFRGVESPFLFVDAHSLEPVGPPCLADAFRSHAQAGSGLPDRQNFIRRQYMSLLHCLLHGFFQTL